MKTFQLLCCFIILNLLLISESFSSTCYGTTKNGSLEGGVKLPSGGDNFTSYGIIPEIAGRTFVHDLVRKIVIEAYADLYKVYPEKKFKYAETGFEEGGRFKPHKTHQNGLSIDFMVPVVNKKGESIYFSTTPMNKYGYDIEFDHEGKFNDLTIDFDALGAHIVALHKSALKNNADIWRVIFDPELQSRLFKSEHGQYIQKNILIPREKSWVRHDEHYHVDFKIKCR